MKQNLVHVTFQPTESPWTGLRRASSRIIADATTQQEEIPEAKRIHLLRVTVKRLRAYLRLLQPSLEADKYRRENRFLRDIGRSLSATRDRQVALRTLKYFEESAKKKSVAAALQSVHEAIDGGLATHETDQPQDLDAKMSNVIAALQESLDRFSQLESDARGWDLLEPGFNKTYRGARRHFRSWIKTADILEAHDCRKLAKYLMFQLELVEPANQEGISLFRKNLRRLEKKLGQLNDCVILRDFVEKASTQGRLSKKERKIVRKEIRAREKEVSSTAKRLGRDTLGEKPAALVKTWEIAWSQWTGGKSGAGL